MHAATRMHAAHVDIGGRACLKFHVGACGRRAKLLPTCLTFPLHGLSASGGLFWLFQSCMHQCRSVTFVGCALFCCSCYSGLSGPLASRCYGVSSRQIYQDLRPHELHGAADFYKASRAQQLLQLSCLSSLPASSPHCSSMCILGSCFSLRKRIIV